MPLLRRLSSIAFLLSATAAAAEDTVVRGLDHIPLAVKDLEQSQADFEALGFVLKPSRPHANGLRNTHAKFPAGTEIELITALSASDALSSDYLSGCSRETGQLSRLFSLRTQRRWRRRLALQNLSLKRVFFSAGSTRRPTGLSISLIPTPRSPFPASGWQALRPSAACCTLLGPSRAEKPACSPFGTDCSRLLAARSAGGLPARKGSARARSIHCRRDAHGQEPASCSTCPRYQPGGFRAAARLR